MSNKNRLLTHFYPLSALVGLFFATSITAFTGQVTFRVVSPMNDSLQQPVGITEGSPGTFYSMGGSSTQTAFSITTQGTKTNLATFGANHNGMAFLVSASNQRFYAAVSSPTTINAFSVSAAANSKQIYSAQTVGFEALQNLPDGTLLGVAGTISATSSWLVAKSDLEGNATTIYAFPSRVSSSHASLRQRRELLWRIHPVGWVRLCVQGYARWGIHQALEFFRRRVWRTSTLRSAASGRRREPVRRDHKCVWQFESHLLQT